MNRCELAYQYHKKGYNCAQSVLMSFQDVAGLSEKQCLAIASGFGAGAGTGELCGALTGAIMVLDLLTQTDTENAVEAKKRAMAQAKELQKRFSERFDALRCAELLTDIGTEELGHLEIVGALVHQLTRNLTEEQIRTAGFDTYFVDHTTGVFPQFASGYPWSAATMQVTGDTIADLTEDLAAEQKARVTYDNILRLSDDPDVNDVIKFLRAREIVHFQRFGEALQLAKDRLDQKNVYYLNPSFDK